jgi:hypothetical protein
LLNHIPVVGTLIGLGLLALALWRRADELKRAALGLLLICALIALPTYMTGEPAENGVEGLPGVSKALIEQHEKAAGVALGGSLVVGVLALVGLIWFRGNRVVPAWFGVITLTGTLAVSVLMGWTASLGGQVRHTEIRSHAAATTPESHHHE